MANGVAVSTTLVVSSVTFSSTETSISGNGCVSDAHADNKSINPKDRKINVFLILPHIYPSIS